MKLGIVGCELRRKTLMESSGSRLTSTKLGALGFVLGGDEGLI
jgi:hypothetical protein